MQGTGGGERMKYIYTELGTAKCEICKELLKEDEEIMRAIGYVNGEVVTQYTHLECLRKKNEETIKHNEKMIKEMEELIDKKIYEARREDELIYNEGLE